MKGNERRWLFQINIVAPPVGLEPTTSWLTASAQIPCLGHGQLLYHTELRRLFLFSVMILNAPLVY